MSFELQLILWQREEIISLSIKSKEPAKRSPAVFAHASGMRGVRVVQPLPRAALAVFVVLFSTLVGASDGVATQGPPASNEYGTKI